MSDFDYRIALEAAIEAAHAAAHVLRADFHRAGGPRGHGDHAEADEPAERAARAILLERFPCAYLGEETGSAGGADDRHRWLVDPNDGTKSYLLGIRGSSVSIGLLRDGVPVLGVVYAFGYPDDAGDLVSWAEGTGPIRRNGEPVESALRDLQPAPGQIVLVSRDADRNPAANLRCVKPARYLKIPSVAYRLALVAAGEAVAQVSLNGPGAWDYGAGHALVRAAGGVLVDERGEEIRYGASGKSRVRRCFGGAPAIVRELVQRDWDRVLEPGAAGERLEGVSVRSFGAPVRDTGLLSRAQGCLLGQVAGDSLGGLVEFGQVDGPANDLRDGGYWGLLAGQPTDDSELALALARALLRRRGFDRDEVLEAYRAWYRSGPFDVGGTIGAALGGRGPRPDSKANGALMRVSPVGLLAAGKPEAAARWAREDAALTHPNSVCGDASAAFAAAIADALVTGDGRSAYATAVATASTPEIRGALEAARHGPPADFTTYAGLVTVALHNAFYRLLQVDRGECSVEEALLATVAAGGDTDTNAAIAGTLLGAAFGRDALPARWRRAVLSCRPLPGSGTAHPRPPEYWPVDVLELAEALVVAGRSKA